MFENTIDLINQVKLGDVDCEGDNSSLVSSTW